MVFFGNKHCTQNSSTVPSSLIVHSTASIALRFVSGLKQMWDHEVEQCEADTTKPSRSGWRCARLLVSTTAANMELSHPDIEIPKQQREMKIEFQWSQSHSCLPTAPQQRGGFDDSLCYILGDVCLSVQPENRNLVFVFDDARHSVCVCLGITDVVGALWGLVFLMRPQRKFPRSKSSSPNVWSIGPSLGLKEASSSHD